MSDTKHPATSQTPKDDPAWVKWLDRRTGIRSLLQEALYEPIPGGCAMGLCLRFRADLSFSLADRYGNFPDALLCSFLGSCAHDRSLYIQGRQFGPVYSQRSCLWRQRHHHPAYPSHLADPAVWIL
jgi:hypothetical protein